MPKYILLFFFPLASFSQKILTQFRITPPKNTKIEKSIHINILEKSKVVFKQENNLDEPCFSYSTKSNGQYSLIVSNPCCETIKIEWLADTIKTPNFSFQIVMQEKVINLKEVTIKANLSRYKYAGDTLIIKIDDINTRPHADASALFDHIAGLQIGMGGNVSVLGKAVQEITIDGKRIFGGVPTLVLNNIRADMIKRMEFIEKKLPNGQSIRQLNLQLKDNRKKGFYGNIGLGTDLKKHYLADERLNKLLKNGFLNQFFTKNNINQPILNDKDVERITHNSFRNAMNTNGSIIGLYENNLNTNDDENDFNTELKGLNQFSSGGVSLNHGKGKFEFDSFILYDNNEQYINQEQKNSMLLFEDLQTKTRKTENKTKLQKISIVSEGKLQTKNKSNVSFSNQFTYNKTTNASLDSTENKFDIRALNYSLNKMRYELSENLTNSFQFSWIKKGIKKGSNTSFYFNNHISIPNENKQVRIGINGINANTFTLNTEKYYLSTQLQVIKSIPITKRLLFEGKALSIINDQGLEQKDNIISSRKMSDFQAEIGSYFLYQQKRWNFISGFSYWLLQSERRNDLNSFYLQQKFSRLHLSKFQYRFANSDISLSYFSKPHLPSFENILGVIDSTEIENINISNVMLRAYIQKKKELSLTQNIGANLHFMISAHHSTFENTPINEIIIDEISGFQTQKITNNEKNTSEKGFNFSLFQVATQNTVSWAIFGLFLQNKSYLGINKEFDPIKTEFVLISQNIKWKINKNARFNIDLQAQSYKNRTQTLWNLNVQTKSQWDFKEKYYTDVQSNFFINKNNAIQPFFDFSVNRYFLKNKGLGVAIICKNLFDKRYFIQVNQSLNQQEITKTNNLPRLVMIKLNFYPENWQ